MKTTLIILTRNEVEGLRRLFSALPLDKVDEVFAVDYRSTDGTKELFREKNIRVYEQDKKGRGEAFRLAAQKSSGDILIFFSPDGNEDPADIPKLIELVRGGADLAVASRFMKGSRHDEAHKLIPLRAWANRSFTLLANIFFGGRMTDAINGYRAIRKDKFQSLRLDAEGFAVEYQMSIRCMKLGYKIEEIPTIEGDRIGGQSTARSLPTGLQILRILLKEIWIGKRF